MGGFAQGMKTLLLSSIGVAVGESALTPAAHSIIADYTDKAARPKAIAIYSLGLAIGTFLALSLGGFLNDQFGWRMTLFIIGATGIVLCVLVLTTVRRSEEHTSELQSLMRSSYAVFCLKKKKQNHNTHQI